ncbi:MAG: helix-turn-helix transcriptional regulator [Clostridium sp.]|nr:helix-turn-helix transcriptional regulator [Clostridium sp.]
MVNEESIASALSFLIKKQRKAMKLTQEELAKKIGLSTRHIGKLEDGTYLPKMITYLKLTEVLKFDIEDLKHISAYVQSEDEAKIFEMIKSMKPSELKLSREMIELLVKRRANA